MVTGLVSVYCISESQLCEQVAATLNNNTVELHSLYTALKEAESQCLRKISSQGHHSEVRAVAFSSDNLAVVSASAESVKMWNR
jgi:U3 small nucleolar RNA-associated protein 12